MLIRASFFKCVTVRLGREAVVRGKFVSDSSITGSGPTRYQGPNGFSVSFSVIQHCKIVARKQSVSNIGNCHAEGQPKFLFCSMMIRPNQLAFRCDCGKSPIPTRATIVGHTVSIKNLRSTIDCSDSLNFINRILFVM